MPGTPETARGGVSSAPVSRLLTSYDCQRHPNDLLGAERQTLLKHPDDSALRPRLRHRFST
jgi:hypothetical protein